jgi:hypothetical protein
LYDDRLEELTSCLEKQKIKEEKKSEGIAMDSNSDEEIPFKVQKVTENPIDI